MDQIGLDDGSSIDTTNILANQYFEASFSAYDVAIIDDFDNSNGLSGSSMSMVVGGWNGYTGAAGISALQANSYLTQDSGSGSLEGDVGYEDQAGTPDIDPNFNALPGFELIGMSFSAPMPYNTGTGYCSMIPTNEFGSNGQTGCAISTIGNGQSWQCNPNGGFGFGTIQEQPYNAAYRILGGTGDPCDLNLPAQCNADISGPNGVPDGIVGVDDVLTVIGTFNEQGNGESRPQGDCAPMPTGNCIVDVDDLLECIGQFGTDCQPRGACCYGVNGCDEDYTEGECGNAGGDWLGQGSSCASCVSGACCDAAGDCSQATPADCEAAGSNYQGDSTSCNDVTCVPAPDNNDCAGAFEIFAGDTGIDNTYATTTGPGLVDDCTGQGTPQVFNDLWYSYNATCTGTLTLSTCNQADFDTIIAVYSDCPDDGGTQVACNDDGDGCTGFTSELGMDVTAGVNYKIRVGSWGDGAIGTGVLSVSCDIPVEGACCVGEDCLPLLPQDCADFGGVYNDGDCATVECGTSNDTCEDAIAVDCPSATNFDTSTASDSGFGEPDDTQCSGTYLDWTGSPDVWFSHTVVGDGTMDISLCDASSYDTSLVLYQGDDCGSLVQVACNGDASVETGCQSYYSGIYGHPVVDGQTYYIRIGGWQAATGPGTMTLTCVGANATGACCLLDESCIDGQTASECNALAGFWYVDQACADVTCPEVINCETGNGANPTTVDGAWTAGTSDIGAGYARAAEVLAPSISEVTVYGLSLVYNAGWSACATPETMIMGVGPCAVSPPNGTFSGYSTISNYVPTTIVYAGVYSLHGWTWSGLDTLGDTINSLQVESASNGAGECWFLWMSSDSGTSYIDDGTGWVADTFGVNYCIVE
ncbi:MAG: hypothetical protein VX527_10450 [Planctomycetota bacterium]|nr:hypothetical protein [Planctomycetota bacterium]